ncbi:MAG: PD-(D/E)XK nuclease family protein [Dehalococcoidia bacterium]|nr:PD-(D/E)XK nuclease family protein [Dehalococcoidia bacterium]
MTEEPPRGAEGVEFFSVPVRSRRREKIAPLRLSPTAVSTFRQCRQLYKFLYIDKLGDQYFRPRPYFTMGNHVHATLKGLLQLWPPERRTVQAMEKLLGRNWRRYRTGFRSKKDERRWAEKALAQLRAFMANHDLTAKPLMLEEPVEAEITPGLILRGRVDRVDREADGSLHIIDYKTGNLPPEMDWTQLELHALALSRRSPSPVHRLSYLYLGPSVLESVAVSAGRLDEVCWELLGLARKVRRERRYRPRPGPRCQGCDFRSICPRGADAEPGNETEGQLELWDDFFDDGG